MTQSELLVQAFSLIAKSGVCKQTPLHDWVKILLFLHKKGWLYANVKEEEVKMIAAMYRVKKITKKTTDVYPEKEEGNILYIPFFVSVAKDKNEANALFKQYLNKHPKVREIAFFKHGDEKKLHRFVRVNKEKKNVKEKVPHITGNA